MDKGRSQDVNEWSQYINDSLFSVQVFLFVGLITVTLGTAGFCKKWKDEWKTVYMSFQVRSLHPAFNIHLFSTGTLSFVFAAGSHCISCYLVYSKWQCDILHQMHIPQHDVTVYCIYHRAVTQVSISLVTPLLLYCSVLKSPLWFPTGHCSFLTVGCCGGFDLDQLAGVPELS